MEADGHFEVLSKDKQGEGAPVGKFRELEGTPGKRQ